MYTSLFRRPLFHFSILLTLMLAFAFQMVPVLAADSTANLTANFGSETFGTITIGQTVRLGINIFFPGPNPVRATSLQCFESGGALSGQSISRLPNSTVFPANSSFQSEQYYRAVGAGTSTVWCEFKGVDTVTGASVTATSIPTAAGVSGEQRLYVYSYASTNSAQVGEIISLRILYGNRGPNTLINAQVSCSQLGRGIAFVGQTQGQSTIPSGQSSSAEFRLQGVFSGASGLFLCTVSATDAVTGEYITLNTTPVSIVIR